MLGPHVLNIKVHTVQIVDVRVAYIKKLAILGNRETLVTANYSPVFFSCLWGPLDPVRALTLLRTGIWLVIHGPSASKLREREQCGLVKSQT